MAVGAVAVKRVGALPVISFAQLVRLVQTPAGWRVGRLQLTEYRDEPGEPDDGRSGT